MSISTNSARIGEMTTDYLDNALSQTPMVQNGQESTGKIQSGINENAITAYTEIQKVISLLHKNRMRAKACCL